MVLRGGAGFLRVPFAVWVSWEAAYLICFFHTSLEKEKGKISRNGLGGLRLGGLELRGGCGQRRAEAGSVPTATLHYIRSGGPGVSFLSFFFAFFSFSLSLLSLFSWLGVHMCTYVCTTGFRFPHNFFFLFRPFVFWVGGLFFFFPVARGNLFHHVSSWAWLFLFFIFYFFRCLDQRALYIRSHVSFSLCLLLVRARGMYNRFFYYHYYLH